MSNLNADETVVVVRDVCKEFHRDQLTIPVLSGINLELSTGDYLALMGPSGSGKTTLLNLIAGLDRPTSGDVIVCGLTAYENVELPLTLTSLSRRDRDDHVKAALEVVGLQDRMDHYPRQLSGGQEQRVAIARAIVTDPTLLVADEPTGDLDAKSAAEILDLMHRLNTEKEFRKTIVMVTHDPNAADRARRILHLEKGLLVSEVTDNRTRATVQ